MREITTTTTTARDEAESGGGGLVSVLAFWAEAGFGELRPGWERTLRELTVQYGAEEVITALRIADEASSEGESKRTLRYVRGVLEKRARDRRTEEEVAEAEREMAASVRGGLPPRRVEAGPQEPAAIRVLRELRDLREARMEAEGDVVRVWMRDALVGERQYGRQAARALASAGMANVRVEFCDARGGDDDLRSARGEGGVDGTGDAAAVCVPGVRAGV